MTCQTALVSVVVLALVESASAQQVVFKDVKARFSRSQLDRVLVDKDAELVLDDAARILSVKTERNPLKVGYDDVVKVVFDRSTHMRGGAMGTMMGGLGGAAISSKRVEDYWCYLEYGGADGNVQRYMLEVAKESSARVIEKLRALFGDKVVVAEFKETAVALEKDTLKDLQSKHDLKVDETSHPTPEVKPDKALIVVVCPPLAARDAGKGNQFKVHANDRVEVVNRMGTYSFAYLDPGEYKLVSQAENASGFTMTLEAGKDYYFLQDTFMGMMKARTQLSRHSKELVMYQLGGSHYADWTRK
jgi:hypothetical protein